MCDDDGDDDEDTPQRFTSLLELCSSSGGNWQFTMQVADFIVRIFEAAATSESLLFPGGGAAVSSPTQPGHNSENSNNATNPQLTAVKRFLSHFDGDKDFACAIQYSGVAQEFRDFSLERQQKLHQVMRQQQQQHQQGKHRDPAHITASNSSVVGAFGERFHGNMNTGRDDLFFAGGSVSSPTIIGEDGDGDGGVSGHIGASGAFSEGGSPSNLTPSASAAMSAAQENMSLFEHSYLQQQLPQPKTVLSHHCFMLIFSLLQSICKTVEAVPDQAVKRNVKQYNCERVASLYGNCASPAGGARAIERGSSIPMKLYTEAKASAVIGSLGLEGGNPHQQSSSSSSSAQQQNASSSSMTLIPQYVEPLLLYVSRETSICNGRYSIMGRFLEPIPGHAGYNVPLRTFLARDTVTDELRTIKLVAAFDPNRAPEEVHSDVDARPSSIDPVSHARMKRRVEQRKRRQQQHTNSNSHSSNNRNSKQTKNRRTGAAPSFENACDDGDDADEEEEAKHAMDDARNIIAEGATLSFPQLLQGQILRDKLVSYDKYFSRALMCGRHCPALCTTYDVVVDERVGGVFVVSANIEHGALLFNLDQEGRCARSRDICTARCLWYCRQLLQAMVYLHERGCVHGGMSSRDIMLAQDDQMCLKRYGMQSEAIARSLDELRALAPSLGVASEEELGAYDDTTNSVASGSSGVASGSYNKEDDEGQQEDKMKSSNDQQHQQKDSGGGTSSIDTDALNNTNNTNKSTTTTTSEQQQDDARYLHPVCKRPPDHGNMNDQVKGAFAHMDAIHHYCFSPPEVLAVETPLQPPRQATADNNNSSTTTTTINSHQQQQQQATQPDNSKTTTTNDLMKRDIWSLGVCFFVLVFGRLPFMLDVPVTAHLDNSYFSIGVKNPSSCSETQHQQQQQNKKTRPSFKTVEKYIKQLFACDKTVPDLAAFVDVSSFASASSQQQQQPKPKFTDVTLARSLSDLPPPFLHFLTRMIAVDPKTRVSATTALAVLDEILASREYRALCASSDDEFRVMFPRGGAAASKQQRSKYQRRRQQAASSPWNAMLITSLLKSSDEDEWCYESSDDDDEHAAAVAGRSNNNNQPTGVASNSMDSMQMESRTSSDMMMMVQSTEEFMMSGSPAGSESGMGGMQRCSTMELHDGPALLAPVSSSASRHQQPPHQHHHHHKNVGSGSSIAASTGTTSVPNPPGRRSSPPQSPGMMAREESSGSSIGGPPPMSREDTAQM